MNVLVAARGRTLLFAAVVLVVLVVTACSDGSTATPEARASAVYAEIVRWFARANTDAEPLPVFIEPRGAGATIGLDVQAELIKDVQDVATVRFIDSRDEALVTNDDGTVVVAGGGVLLRLAPVVEEGSKVRIEVDVHEHDEQFRTEQFDLGLVGTRWEIEQPPTSVPTS